MADLLTALQRVLQDEREVFGDFLVLGRAAAAPRQRRPHRNRPRRGGIPEPRRGSGAAAHAPL